MLDAGSLIYPAFHVLRGLSTSDGFPTGAIYGFTRTLIKIERLYPSRYAACCFDTPAKTFRHEKYADYKATRPKMDEDLVAQIPIIKRIIKAFGIPIFEKSGYEADDIIATLAKIATKRLHQILCVSSDKDLLQLVDEKVSIIKPKRSGSQGSFEYLGPKEVKGYLGVPPHKVADFLALKGDNSDNIPGVPYVGKKRAVRLLEEYGSVEEILKNRERLADKRVRESVEKSVAHLQLSRELVELDTDVPLDQKDPLATSRVSRRNTEELKEIFRDLEFESILSEFNPRSG